MWISVRWILFTFSSHPEAPETAKPERHLHTKVSVPRGSSLTPPPLPFHAHRNARQTSERVGVNEDSDINKPASKTVHILPVTLHLLPVVLAMRACTFCFRDHNRSLMRDFWSEPAPMKQNLLPHGCLNQVNASLIHLFIQFLFFFYWCWKRNSKERNRVQQGCDRCCGKLPAKWDKRLPLITSSSIISPGCIPGLSSAFI